MLIFDSKCCFDSNIGEIFDPFTDLPFPRAFSSAMGMRIDRCTLGQQHAGYYNFYRTLFSEAELDLAQRVADSPVKNIIDIIVQFIQEQSANSFFFLDKAVVQRIRKL